MFFAADGYGHEPLELSGSGGPRQEIRNLQASLARLVHFAHRPEVDPGPSTGQLNERTMISIGGSLDLLKQRLPHWVIDPLERAMMLGVSSSEAKNVVGRYVTELRYAADQASDFYARLPGPSSFPQPPSFTSLRGFFDQGWYTDPPKLAIIGGLILLGIWAYSHFTSKR